MVSFQSRFMADADAGVIVDGLRRDGAKRLRIVRHKIYARIETT
jgi:hypothetical protein